MIQPRGTFIMKFRARFRFPIFLSHTVMTSERGKVAHVRALHIGPLAIGLTSSD